MRSHGSLLGYANFYFGQRDRARQQEQEQNFIDSFNKARRGQPIGNLPDMNPDQALKLQDFAMTQEEAKQKAQKQQGINRTMREVANGYTQPGTGPVRPEFMQEGGYTPVQTREFTLPETLSKFALHGDKGLETYDTYAKAKTGADDRKTLMEFRKQPGKEFAPKLPELPKPVTGTYIGENGMQTAYSVVPGREAQTTQIGRAQEKSPLVSVNMPGDKRETKFQETMGKTMADEYSAIQTAGRDSHTNIARLQRAKALVQRVNTGAMKPTATAVKRVIKDLGYDLEKLGFADDVGFAEALKAVSVDLTMDTVQKTKGAVSNKEMDLFAQVAPQLSTSPEGNLLIIEMATKMHQNAQQVARMSRQYYRENKGRYDEGFYDVLDRYYTENPLFTTELLDRVTELTGRGLLQDQQGENPFTDISDADLLKSLGLNAGGQ